MDKDLQDYFDAVPSGRKEKFEKLHSLIMSRFPGASISMQYKMPTYRYQDGWVAIANQKSYISLYTCGAHHLQEFKANYPDYKTGSGCINFRNKDEIPDQAILQVIEHAMLKPKG